jgi:hypothetical protein
MESYTVNGLLSSGANVLEGYLIGLWNSIRLGIWYWVFFFFIYFILACNRKVMADATNYCTMLGPWSLPSDSTGVRPQSGLLVLGCSPLPVPSGRSSSCVVWSVSVTAGEERERSPRNSRRAGTGTRERERRGRSDDAVEGQGAAGDATFRDSDGGMARADLAR